ncbi:MAG: ferredoxin family protein [Planctomycetes bacterium]|nr:ferredoxin family protein [Planctomycetota bacterium]
MAAGDCAERPGIVVPVIDRSRCEAAADCVRVCPYHVFDVRRLGPDETSKMSAFSRLRAFLHGGKQAVAVRSDECHACGLCVQACPEGAISLAPVAKG